MKKRRLEIAILALLVMFTAVDRPYFSIDVTPDRYQIGRFVPQQIDTVRELGVIAVKLLATWIENGV